MDQNKSNKSVVNFKNSLGGKITLLVFFIAVFLSLLSITLQTYLIYKQSVQEATATFDIIEQSYLPSLEVGMWEIDEDRIDILMDGIATLSSVGKATLLVENGTTKERVKDEIGNVIAQKSFDVEYTIDGQTFSLGSLIIEIGDAKIRNELWVNTRFVALSTVLTLIVTAIIITLIFQQSVSRHLVSMALYTSDLDLNKLGNELKLDRPMSATKDELDQVTTAINAMRVRIQKDLKQQQETEKELREYRYELEQLVEKRTQELQLKSEMLEAKTQELFDQNKELDAYAHTVAHDLKQPVNNLIGVLTLFEGTDNYEDTKLVKDALGMIDASAHKMRQIIDSLLKLSVIRKSESVEIEEMDAKESAEQAILRLKPMVSEYNAEINYSTDQEWPLVHAKHQWVEEVWVNYLSNAIKYGGKPPVVDLKAENLGNGFARFSVADNGKGIDIHQEHLLYQAFNRLHDASYDGHGLGLSIVKRIVDKLGGQVGFEPRKNGGSIFWFTLPTKK
jgi:signal transduction histidine kinase